MNAKQGRVSLRSVGEVQAYIRGADSYENLFERIQNIERELPDYGLSPKYRSLIMGELQEKRRQLIN